MNGHPPVWCQYCCSSCPRGAQYPTISELYQTCHCLAYSRSKVKGDEMVVHALDQQLAERKTGPESHLQSRLHIKFIKPVYKRIGKILKNQSK